MDRRALEKRHDQMREEVDFLRSRCRDLEQEVLVSGPELYRAYQKIDRLEQQRDKLAAENKLLKQKVKDLTLAAESLAQAGVKEPAVGPVKPPVIHHRRRRPGRKEGHAAALRPMPDHIDVHQEVPLARDSAGHDSCPCCSCALSELKDHERVVEDIIPQKVVVKCYHTRSGYCPNCRKRVESRAPEQPPAANLPHGQLGVNALATAMVLRIAHRLPFRQVTAVFANLPELSVSPGAIARQVQRVAEWFDGDYEKLMLQLRCAPIVYADETGWRVDGKNQQLWAVTTPDKTLYHVNKSRGSKVIVALLGKGFDGTLVSDFYSAYSKMDCKKQKCLAHLLRELKQSAEKFPAFAQGSFFGHCKKLIKQAIRLKTHWEELDDKQYDQRARRLESQLQKLAQTQYDEPNARRIAKRLKRHQKELTAFLWTKDLDATNNAAERAIRPVVVARKISGGSRSENGANAWATLASLMKTATQQGRKLLETTRSMLIANWASAKPPTLPAGP